MNRIDRLTTILVMLQSRRILRAQDIADQFGITLRTVYRDIRSLENAGVPIIGEAGKGYSLVNEYRLSPIVLSHAEASALDMGGKFAEHFTQSSVKPHITSALLKIRSVLPAERKDYWEQLEKTTAIVPDFPDSKSHDPNTITQLQEAIVHRHVLHIVYRSRTSGTLTERDIQPLGLLFYAEHWHLIAFCRLRQGLRDFRVDLIGTLTNQGENFLPIADFSLKEYFEQNLRSQSTHSVQVKFPSHITLSEKDKYYYGCVEELECEHGTLVTFMTTSLEWIFHWLLGYGAAIEVISPIQLRHMFLSEAQRLVERYQK